MYKISISDRHENIINVIDLRFQEEYLLESDDERLALGTKISEIIKGHEILFDRNHYYRYDLCFYITTLLLGLVMLSESYSLGILETIKDYLILRCLGLLTLFSFIGVLILGGVKGFTDIVLNWFRKGKHGNPPDPHISTLGTVIVICIFYFIIKLFVFLMINDLLPTE